MHNPQTLNLYGYVGNNPTTATDPDGHFREVIGGQNNGCWFQAAEACNSEAPSTTTNDSGSDATDNSNAPSTAQPQAGQDSNNQQAHGNQSQFNQHGHWEYSQSTGQMTHVLPDGTKQVVGTGYSGKDEGLNNPGAQDKPNIGPIPQGNWKIEPQKDNVTGEGHKLPASMRLDPSKDTNTFGRSGFLIHGDNAQHDQSASNGCIILDRATRNLIGHSGENNLTVVP